MPFLQSPPALGNQYLTDRVLRSYLSRVLPPDVHRAIEPSLQAMGELAGGALYELQLADRTNEPTLTPWDAWGRRVDHIEVSPLWKRAAQIAVEHGLVALAYERAHAQHSRIHQLALAYLFDPSSDMYTCPLAMTDGAARTLLAHQNRMLIDRAVPRLTSRDPARAWTSGQWMTERTGGSDVGLSETVARGEGGEWRLFGTKWFTSATTSQMALTLGRPEGNPPGGRGLALFYVETRDPRGALRDGIFVNRLKDKLGTRKVPTAELMLDGVLAIPVAGTTDGVRNITPMLNITRTWNAIGAASGMRRGVALARDYAAKRVAFGASLSEKPLHLETLATLQAELEGAFHLTFRAVELLGREEAGLLTAREGEVLRLITPIAKLTTARQAIATASEVLESFGGAGYVEDTGLPRLLRDAQVLSIWEGTTNVLSLDALRAIVKGDDTLEAYAEEISSLAATATEPDLAGAGRIAMDAIGHARAWAAETAKRDGAVLEAGARRFALTLGRALELALLVRQAQWSIDHQRDGRAAAAALRFAYGGAAVDCLPADHNRFQISRADTRGLANDTPLAHDDP
jgi:alkylation response protein AidB-like acyl-CoA dehydrogenase